MLFHTDWHQHAYFAAAPERVARREFFLSWKACRPFAPPVVYDEAVQRRCRNIPTSAPFCEKRHVHAVQILPRI